jgi:hypothetical protein
MEFFSMRAFLPEKGIELGNDIALAASLSARMKGLLGIDRLDTGKGLLICPCKGIHTFFMRFSIDAVFLDKENRILALFRNLPPNRLTPVYRKASTVLELPAGTVSTNIIVGDHIDFS